MPDLAPGRRQIGVKTKIQRAVVIAPAPLKTGDLDRYVGAGGVLHIEDSLGCWHRHRDQNNERNDCPDNLYQCALVKIYVSFGTLRLAELENRIKHQAEHNDKNNRTDPQNVHVQSVNLCRDRRRGWGNVDVIACQRRQTDQGQKYHRAEVGNEFAKAPEEVCYFLHAKYSSRISKNRGNRRYSLRRRAYFKARARLRPSNWRCSFEIISPIATVLP